MRKRKFKLVAGSVVLLAAALLSAYKISPIAGIHEGMTRAAKQCLDAGGEADGKPGECRARLVGAGKGVEMFWLHDSSFAWYDLVGWVQWLTGATPSYPNLGQAVRWPDDPTQQIGGWSVLKFGVSMAAGCDRLASGNGEEKANDIDDGLLCNSHYGSMQFFHAQAARMNEPAGDTHYKIMRWAEFLFRVASQMSDAELDTAYCEYFSGDDLFHQAMRPSADVIPCGEPGDEGWNLTTLFTLRCENVFSSKTCNAEGGTTRFEKARIYAAGALLHLIQDSYSQSHCERGRCYDDPATKEPVAKVECRPITMFTTYRGQKGHGAADWKPRFAESCDTDTGIDNPITASARALWHIQNKSSVEAFLADMERVFGTREQIIRNGRPSSLGTCFGDSVAAR